MKKSITTLALLCAVLACQELDSRDNKVLLDDDQLKKLNDTLAAKDAEIEQLKADKVTAENAKSQAEADKAKAEDAKTSAEAKVAELQAVIDKTPANQPPAGGSDTHTGQEDNFEDWYAQQGYVQEAKRMLGQA